MWGTKFLVKKKKKQKFTTQRRNPKSRILKSKKAKEKLRNEYLFVAKARQRIWGAIKRRRKLVELQETFEGEVQRGVLYLITCTLDELKLRDGIEFGGLKKKEIKIGSEKNKKSEDRPPFRKCVTTSYRVFWENEERSREKKKKKV